MVFHWSCKTQIRQRHPEALHPVEPECGHHAFTLKSSKRCITLKIRQIGNCSSFLNISKQRDYSPPMVHCSGVFIIGPNRPRPLKVEKIGHAPFGQTLIRALVHSRLDYCNGTLAGLPQYQLNKLQSILRASARLVLLLPGRASVSSLMRVRLHWLPFPQRIKFKLCSTVYKCLHDAAPAYLSEFCVPLSSQAGHSQLRSAAAGDLLIPPTRTVTIGGRGFFRSGSCCLEQSFRRTLKMELWLFPVFKKLLKTHLFVTIWTAALRFCGDCMKGALQVPVSIQFKKQNWSRPIGQIDWLIDWHFRSCLWTDHVRVTVPMKVLYSHFIRVAVLHITHFSLAQVS